MCQIKYRITFIMLDEKKKIEFVIKENLLNEMFAYIYK